MPWHESIIEVELSKAKVLVNASSVGLESELSPIPAELMPPELLVLDLVYRPRDDPACWPTRRPPGRRATMNGEVMLLHQGAAAFELWTGQPAPLELMRSRLDEALATAAAPPLR